GGEAGARAHPLGPQPVLVEHDVAADDVRDAAAGDIAENALKHRAVAVPRAPADELRQAEALCLRRDQLGPEAVRTAAQRLLVEHRDHRHDVEVTMHAMQRGAAVLAAAPRDRRTRTRRHAYRSPPSMSVTPVRTVVGSAGYPNAASYFEFARFSRLRYHFSLG